MLKGKRVALYARVSPDGEAIESQLRQLHAVAERVGWAITHEFVEKGVSGSRDRRGRPQYDAMLDAVARGEFDLIAAWSVVRLGRSLQDFLVFLLELQSKRVDLYLHRQALDTSAPMGKGMFQLCDVFAELERSIIQEHAKAGLERARSTGTTPGRASKPSPRIEAKIRELAAHGMGKARIARTLGVGVRVAQRVLAT